jgi:hypothetical protein
VPPSYPSYHRRIVDDEIDALAPAALALEGAKAVGKTATATQRARTVIELDLPEIAEVAAADPRRILDADLPVLIDEWQRVPALWDVVRRAVDAGAAPGSFLLTGSVSADSPGTHTGAGRIIRIRVRPLSLAERDLEQATVSLTELLSGLQPAITGTTTVGLDAYTDEIVASGFPALRSMQPRLRRAQLDGYLARVIDRDFPEAGRSVRNPAALRRWMAAYAAATSTAASYDAIRDAATAGDGNKPAKTTTQPYRDTLERLWILEPVPGWLPTHNHLRELGVAAKHQLVDPALAVALLGLDAAALLSGARPGPPVPRDGTFLGALFESLATQSVRVYAQAAEATVSHLRTHRGEHEVDLIVERRDGKVLAVETKLANTVTDGDVKHLTWLRDTTGGDLLDAVVLTTGTHAYRRRDGIAVIPLALLGP